MICLSETTVTQIIELRNAGKLVGDIARLINWPPERSLKQIQKIVDDMPNSRKFGALSPDGPVYRRGVGNF